MWTIIGIPILKIHQSDSSGGIFSIVFLSFNFILVFGYIRHQQTRQVDLRCKEREGEREREAQFQLKQGKSYKKITLEK